MQFDLEYNETWLHKVNPSVKMFVMVVLFIFILFMHNINFIINFLIAALILYIFFTGHHWKVILLVSIPFLIIFISSSTSMIFFGKGEITWLKWGLLHITEESFYRGLHIGLRAVAFAILGLIFAFTTRPVYLFYSLMQQFKVKPKYAYSFMAAIRMLPIMIEELQTLRYALKVRGVVEQKGVRAFYNKLKAYSIPLLSQSIRRAHRIAVAMEAKRFSQVEKRTYYYKISFSGYDLVYVGYFVLAIYIAFITSDAYPYFNITDVRY
jgi:energy-coupling factor transport system permease protein